MRQSLTVTQASEYAEELEELYAREREQRHAAEDALAKVHASYRTTVRALAAALELRDDDTGGHPERVTALGLRLAERVAPRLAADPQLEYGFLLHDLGKIGLSESILLKPGQLDDEERKQMEFHPLLGEKIIAGVSYLGDLVHDVIVSHHEHWDGTGYPHGLRETQIPLAARIFSVVDSFDAMTSDRPYSSAMAIEDALDELAACSGTQFEPEIVQAFVALMSELERAA